MPPKAKYTGEEIIQKAVEIVKAQGIEHLTARELAKSLDTSVKPIFTAFTNMEEVKQEAFKEAFKIYHQQFERPSDEPVLFKRVGLEYINFSIDEPKLFEFLFMKSQEEKIPFLQFMKKLDDNYNDTIICVQQTYNMTPEQAEQMYEQMWIYCHGIATLCATNQCKFAKEEINNLLENASTGMGRLILGL